MKSVVKSVLLVCVLVLSAQAHADSVLVDQEVSGLQVTGIQYRVNPAMGRAWILVETYDASVHGGDDGSPLGESRVRVPGLSFDAAASEVVFAAATGNVVCAKVVSQPRKLLINPTGACSFHTLHGTRTIDNGFETTTERTVDVYFDTK